VAGVRNQSHMQPLLEIGVGRFRLFAEEGEHEGGGYGDEEACLGGDESLGNTYGNFIDRLRRTASRQP